MAKYVCSICGYVHEGMTAPEKCIICKSPSSQFVLSEDVDYDKERNVVKNAEVDSGTDKVVNTTQNQFEKQNTTYSQTGKQINHNEPVVIDEVAKIIEIIKTEGITNAGKWYQIYHHCSFDEAIAIVKSISMQNNVYCSIDDEYEIMKFDKAILEAVKWYKKKYNCDLQEATNVVNLVRSKHGVQNATNKGCMITILIATITTFSLFCII